MKIQTEELIEALVMVKPGLAPREVTGEIDSTAYIFRKGRVYTYNDEQAVSHPVPKGLKIEGTILADGLYSLLEKTKEKKIEISLNKGELRVNGKRSKAGLFLSEDTKTPIKDIAPKKGDKWESVPKDFPEALDWCLVSVGQDMTKPILTCLHVKGNCIESSDDFRLGQYKMKRKMKEFLLPALSARELRVYDPPVKYRVAANGWVHFRTEHNTIFSCRTLEGKYPSLEKFLKVRGKKIQLPESLVEPLEKTDLFLRDEHGGIKGLALVTINNGWLFVRGEGDIGWFEEKVRIGKRDEVFISFRIRPMFLAEMIKKHSEVVIGDSLMKFETKTATHCIALTGGEDE